ncbi:hypothetical protein C7999DRAFT_36585 [Corynascus novoguineensis]|uniref:Uncharacterized protein n=1 Tax=Corynascus novoguineensis TaxID=1126955 RepID=A0AAN7HI72_9PEZI|nr:hypothetical protein C7999DRAFT_36585 [Corynascus novoguineensis]
MSSSTSLSLRQTPHPGTVDFDRCESDPTTPDSIDLAAHPSWVITIAIEDADLTLGGKPLCAWYEEDRRRLISCVDDYDNDDGKEEMRGRQRERALGPSAITVPKPGP